VFSITNSMTADALSRFVLAVGPESRPPVNQTLVPIPLVTVIPPASPSTFNPNTATYTCGSNAPHFVMASVGVLPHMATQAQITNSVINGDLTRTSTLYDEVTVLSRNSMLSCQVGQTIAFNLVSGTTVNTDGNYQYNLTTFAVLPYEPLNVSMPVAWSVYKWYISYDNEGGQSNLDPFYFSNVTVNVGEAYNFNTRLVTAPVAGIYYIYLSSGAGVGLSGSTFTIQVMLGATGSNVLFGIEHQSKAEGATDLFGHGQIVHLNAGDVVRVVAEAPSYLYSSIIGYEVEWMGMLLYSD